jgi:hypothetical protein
MEKNTDLPAYETPRIEDHGDLTELTAAGHPEGLSDGNYSVGQQLPAGGGAGSVSA